jgi:small subunit ribosomal protein S24e
MIHPDMPNVPKVEIRKKLAANNKTKEDNIVVYGLKTKFGGGKSTGFALIYDNMDDRKKYDSRMNLLRVSDAFLYFFEILYYIIG